MESFERKIRQELKRRGRGSKLYLKEKYQDEIFNKHGIADEEIDCLFDMKKIVALHPNKAFPDVRIDAEIAVQKGRTIKVIFTFDPLFKGKILKGKTGIVTAFVL